MSPGYSLRRLLKAIPTDILIELLPKDLVETLGALYSNTLLDGKEKIIDSLDLNEILTGDNLASIFEYLPKEKFIELLASADLKADTSPTHAAYEFSDKKRYNGLASFFGILVPSKIARAQAAPDIIAKPDYGLFPHQIKAVERIEGFLDEAPHCAILHMPTGAGKTRTALHYVCQYLTHNTNKVVIWLAHSQELLEQASSEFLQAWSFLGNREVQLCKLWGNNQGDIERITDGVVVAGLQKIYSFKNRDLLAFLKIADKASLTVVDEAHMAVAPTYEETISLLWKKKSQNKLLGLSATPGRSWSDRVEDRKLVELFSGNKVTLEISGYDDPVSYLVDNGYLATPTFYRINTDSNVSLSHKEHEETSGFCEIPDSILERLGQDTDRNILIVNAAEKLLQKGHQRIIIFAPSVRSAQIISSVLATKECISLCVTGSMDSHSRKRAIDEFKSDRRISMIMCNFGVLTTGFDAPQTSAAIIARPTMSLVLYSQMVGRATRGHRARGNAAADILTVIDPQIPGFGSIQEAFLNWEDVWA